MYAQLFPLSTQALASKILLLLHSHYVYFSHYRILAIKGASTSRLTEAIFLDLVKFGMIVILTSTPPSAKPLMNLVCLITTVHVHCTLIN